MKKPWHKIKEEQKKRREEIKKLYATGVFTMEELGKRYGVSKQRIKQILTAS